MRKATARLGVGIFLLFILVGTLLPAKLRTAAVRIFPHLHVDKVGHILAFSALAFFLSRIRDWPLKGWHVLAICLLLGVVTELLQTQIKWRHPSLWDVCLDTMGAMVGLGLAAWLRADGNTRKVPVQESE